MPLTQPEGAIRTLASGAYVDAAFSSDGSQLFAVTGNTISVINVASGTTVTTYTIGTQLGAMDVSVDGRYLAIVEEQPSGGTGVLYRVDLTNGSISTFNVPGTSALHDVAFLADGSLVISQEINAPLRVVNWGTSDYWQPTSPIKPDATISVSADGTYIIAQPPGLDWPLHAFDTQTGTGHAVYYDPYAGASIGGPASAVGAVSPDGSLVVQGMTLKVYQGDFSSSFSIAGIHSDLNNPAALTFSADGTKLFVLAGSVDRVFVINTGNWQLSAWYPIEADAVHPLEWSAGAQVPGEMMRVSDDGNFLSIITPTGIQVINLGLAIQPDYNGGPSDDTIAGSNGADTIAGGDGNDILSGADGNDTISGGIGNDWLTGGAGKDTLTGGSGADIFYFGARNEFYNADHITDLSAGDKIQLEAIIFTALNVGTLDPSAFVEGSAATTADHRIIYNSANGEIRYDPDGTGAAGQYLFATVAPGTAITAAMFEVVATGQMTVESSVSYTLAENELNLILTGVAAIDGTGNSLNNELTGNDAANHLVGGAGADRLIGNGGNDYLDGGAGADTMIGGVGDDTYIVDNLDDVVTELAGEGVDTVISSRDINLRSNFENATLTGFGMSAAGNELSNILTGNATINVLYGDDGNDFLYGMAGNDSLGGGAGDDYLDGGDGRDAAGYDFAESAVTVSLAITGPQNTGSGGIDTLVSIETLGGSNFNDFLTAGAFGNSLFGNAGDDFLFGGAGVDQLDGGAGSDVYVIASPGEHSAAEILDRGWDEAVDEVRFTATIAGTLTMFSGDAGIERIVIGTGTGTSAVTTGLLAHNIDASALLNGVEIVGNDGANRLTGGAWADEIFGNAGNDELYGNAGNDLLNGQSGADSMFGGMGDDIYVVDNVGDSTVEAAGAGADLVQSSLTWTLANNVENLTLTGALAIDGTGNTLANSIQGNSASNLIRGLGGDDILAGNGGNDTLEGGTGSDGLSGGDGDDTLSGQAGDDSLRGGAGNDLLDGGDNGEFGDFADYTFGGGVTVNLAITGPQFISSSEGSDTLVNIENITGSVMADQLTGNAGANRLFGAEDSDVLIGAGGIDYLDGGQHNDIYIIASSADHTAAEIKDTGTDVLDLHDQLRFTTTVADTLTLYAGDTGIDFVFIGTGTGPGVDLSGTVAANINASLVANALVITGNDGANILTGTAFHDTLNGNAGNDTLKGNAGNDVLAGGAGSDTLTGGAGNDVFRDIAAGLNGDTVTDLSAGDKIVISNANLAGFSFSLVGNTLTYTGGSLTLAGFSGQLQASAAEGGGVQLTVVQVAAIEAKNDFNGDGRSDVLWRHDGGLVTNWLGLESGGFAPNFPIAGSTVAGSWQIAGTGDFNGDNRADILWRHTSGLITEWLGKADGGFADNFANAAASAATSWHVVGTGDFNGDGKDDVLWRHDSGLVVDWLGSANGSFASNNVSASNVAMSWHVAGTGDFNGDGRADILWRHDSGLITEWLGKENGGFADNFANAAASVATSWHVAGIGDFNGDGLEDILWQHDSGLVTNWLGQEDGGFAPNNDNAMARVAAGWKVAAIGDYNGDLIDDILWRHSGGALAEWLGTEEGGFVGNNSAMPTASLQWHIQAPDILA